MDVGRLCDDLLDERQDLIDLVAPLDDDGWRTATPAPGWTILDQVLHLARGDDEARRAVADPAAFLARRDAVLARADVPARRDTGGGAEVSASSASADLVRAGVALVGVARSADPARRVPWFGPDMALASAVTARIMETWAHGQDVADALDGERTPSPRLTHVAFLGWRALPNSFLANGRPVPTVPVRVELGDPLVGDIALGPDDAGDVVVGGLVDFCLLVTRRRHPSDTDLVATGPVATEWLSIAQCYAGPPGPGRTPGQLA